MRKVVLYGSEQCQDCVKAKEILDAEGIRYGYVDVLGSLAQLKRFIVVRDAHPEVFQAQIAKGHLGIPCLVVDKTEVYTMLPENLDVLR